MQDGVCSEQTMWVPRTDAKGSGYWPTPDCQNHRDGSKLRKDNNLAEGGRHGVSLHHAVYHWPTPTVHGNYNRKGLSKTSGDGLATAVKMCKTPAASDGYTGGLKKDEVKFGNSGSLAQEVESGFLETHRKWPTPSVSDTEGGQQSDRVEQTQSGAYILRKKNKPDSTFGAKLSDAVLFEEKKMWPTPQTRDYKDTLNSRPNKQEHLLDRVRQKIAMENSTGGQLNPTWVEWLMGWPLGWTDLKPLETDKYQQWLQQHGCC